MTRKDYDDSFIHRSVSNYVIQGGLYYLNGPSITAITTQPAIVNEFNQSNLEGTIAMARVVGDPDSATSQWFFNVADNVGLDSIDGGFTVFGTIEGNGMDVVNAINAIPIYNYGAPIDEWPLIGHTPPTPLTSEVVLISTVREIPEPKLAEQLIVDLETGFMAINSVAGSSYQLEVSNDDMVSWSNDGVPKAGTDTVIIWPFPSLAAGQRIFYRVEITP